MRPFVLVAAGGLVWPLGFHGLAALLLLLSALLAFAATRRPETDA